MIRSFFEHVFKKATDFLCQYRKRIKLFISTAKFKVISVICSFNLHDADKRRKLLQRSRF